MEVPVSHIFNQLEVGHKGLKARIADLQLEVSW